MINRGYKDPWRHPHKLAGCHSELSGVVTPQGHSANLLRSVIKLCKLGRLISIFHNFNQRLVCLFCYIIGYRSIQCPSRRLDEYYGCSVYYQYNTMQIGAMRFENVQDMASWDGME